MIKYNEEYSLNDNKGKIVFQKGSENAVSAIYNRGTVHAEWDSNLLKGTFIDTVAKGHGLIEFTFKEDSLEARWKGGIKPGPMRGRWTGVLITSGLEKNSQSDERSLPAVFNSADRVEIRVIVQKFDFYAENIVSEKAELLALTGLEFKSIKWRSQSDLVEDYWWKQEDEFYQFLHENGVEYDAKEYSDWYEFEINVLNDKGEIVFNEIIRG